MDGSHELPLEIWGIIVRDISDLNLFAACRLFRNNLPPYVERFEEKYHGCLTDEFLEKFTGLTELNLSKNHRVTDRGLKKMRKIKVLDLSTFNRPVYTKITNDGIKHLTSLTSLSLNRNYQITEFPTISLTSLNVRSIQSFRVSTTLIEECVNLTHLDVGHSRQVKQEFLGLTRLTKLTSLDSSLSGMVTPNILLQMTNLTNLVIPYYQPITEELKLPNLQRLNIWRCRISPTSLTSLTNLTDLNVPLSSNECVMTDSVLSNFTQLTFLNISGQLRLTTFSLKKLVCLKSIRVFGIAHLLDLDLLSALVNLEKVDTCGSEIHPEIRNALGKRHFCSSTIHSYEHSL